MQQTTHTSDPAALPTMYQHPLAYLIGVEGVALMKAFAGEFDRSFTLARLAEVRRLLDNAEALGDGVDVAPMPSPVGYDGWAGSYDDPGNGIFEIEEPCVLPILDALPSGVAVDAACGTGRLAAYLDERGHQVHGFDSSPLMLDRARRKVPSAAFAEADLGDLPMEDASADLVTCALALAHVEDLRPVFAEFARVLRPGGHLVISDTRGHYIGSRLYPLVTWSVDDTFGYLPTWQHPTSEYLAAAIPTGFLVRSCEEPLRLQPVVDPDDPDDDLEDGSEQVSPPNIWALHAWAPEASNAIYRDHPALVVWHFQKEQESLDASRDDVRLRSAGA